MCSWVFLPAGSRSRELAPAAERPNPEILEVLVGQVSNDAFISVVFDKAFRVLGHAKFFEPVENLLHGGHQRSRLSMTDFSTTAAENLYQYVRESATSYGDCRRRLPPISGLNWGFPFQ